MESKVEKSPCFATASSPRSFSKPCPMANSPAAPRRLRPAPTISLIPDAPRFPSIPCGFGRFATAKAASKP